MASRRKTPRKALTFLTICLAIAVGIANLPNDWSWRASAQDDDAALTVGWAYAPPYQGTNNDGEPEGFFIDLARLIGEELGLTVNFRQYPTINAYFAAQHAGETDLATGVSRTAFLEETSVISDPVGQSRVRIFSRAERAGSLDPEMLSGARIATLPPTIGSQVRSLIERNVEVQYKTLQEAIFALLAGEVDALAATQGTVLHLTRQARIDDQIVASGPPIQKGDRVIAVHSSRAELLGPINEAIAKLGASGQLAALREKHLLEEVAPVPDTLKVAVFHNPPFSFVAEDGTLSGFSVEVFRHLAERSGLRHEFVEVAAADYFTQPIAPLADVLPAFRLSGPTPPGLDLTRSYDTMDLQAYTRADRDAAISVDFNGLKVGTLPDLSSLLAAGAFSPIEVIEEASEFKLVEALLDGNVDVVVEVSGGVEAASAELGVAEEVRVVDVQLPPVGVAIAMRHGLGPVRERLNGAIPSFILSDDYRDLRMAYFAQPQTWSPDPVLVALAIGALAIILVLAGLLFQSARARQQADRLSAENRSVSGRLAAVLDAASSGIFGLSLDGRIVFANAGARHMLGGLNLDLPTDWPKNIRFLGSEDLQPLERSEDPVNRALAGQMIKGETAIMSRQGSSDPRYTRISSAPLSPEVSPDIGTVVIIDDVSEQEKNRQQVERSSRLDALGQLTGGIAHDFNNLLAAIKYSIQLSSVATDVQKREEYNDIALKSVTRGATLTQRLLAFAKRQPGVAKSRRVDEILRELEELMRPTIEEHIGLEFIADDPNLWAYVDVAQLENAMLNLVLNARDAIIRSGKGNRIAVKVRSVAEIEADKELRSESADTYIAQGLHAEHRTDVSRSDGKAFRYVEFSVTDNGPGMDDETKRRSIDPFFTTKDTNSGTGLGLSMVYGFIQQSDGEMRIYSEPGHGTTIRLLLPRGSVAGKREEPVERLPSPTGSGQVVLIVEDEPDLLRIMTDLVMSLGYAVRVAANGTEGLAVVNSNDRIDVLLTDIVMPGGMGGFALADAARKRRPELPIIYMSGYTGISRYEMGNVVAPLIQKPSPPFMLAEALENALDTAKSPARSSGKGNSARMGKNETES